MVLKKLSDVWKTPKILLDVEMGVTLVDQGQESYQNYGRKLQARWKWVYQKAQENNKKESERQKSFRCIPLDVEMGVTLVHQGQESYQNYGRKLQARWKWVYQKAQESNKKESERQKRYYDQKVKCMSIKPEDIVLVHVKVPSGQHKIIDWWEDKHYRVLSQLDEQPVFKVQPENAVDDENIRVLHRNMLFPVQTIRDQSPRATTESVNENKRHFALMKANLIMERHFDNYNYDEKVYLKSYILIL